MEDRSRRSLLKSLVGGGIGASIFSFLYPVINFILPPPSEGLGIQTMEAGSENELQPNSGKVFQFGNEPALLVRTAENELRAFSVICPHLGCTVNYDASSKTIWCPCHNGMFDLHGRNIAGPPPRPLTEYRVNLRNGQVVVTKGA